MLVRGEETRPIALIVKSLGTATAYVEDRRIRCLDQTAQPTLTARGRNVTTRMTVSIKVSSCRMGPLE
jgi:hypothetical protein